MTRKRPRFQFRLRALFVLTTIAAVLLAAYATCDRVGRKIFRDVLAGKTGPVPSREDWPEPLKAVLADWKEGELDPGTIQVHCLCQGFDPEYVWRMDAAPGLFEQLAERWELTEISRPDLACTERPQQLCEPDFRRSHSCMVVTERKRRHDFL